MVKPDERNCAVREMTADGVPVGRCWCYLSEGDICPRHGNVKAIMEKYRNNHKPKEKYEN